MVININLEIISAMVLSSSAPDLAFALARARLANEKVKPSLLSHLESEDSAYAVHDRAHRLGILGARIGWKVGVCTEKAYKSWGMRGPGIAPLFASGMWSSGALVSDTIPVDAVEAEVAFILSEDLRPLQGGNLRTPQDVAVSISHVLPVLELCGTRLGVDAKPLGKLADFLLNAGVVLGDKRKVPSLPFLKQLDMSACILTRNGGQNESDIFAGRGGSGAVHSHPLQSLAYLANALNAQGDFLRAGDIVITGAATLCSQVRTGDSFCATFEGLPGSVRVRFTSITAETARGVGQARM